MISKFVLQKNFIQIYAVLIHHVCKSCVEVSNFIGLAFVFNVISCLYREIGPIVYKKCIVMNGRPTFAIDYIFFMIKT